MPKVVHCYSMLVHLESGYQCAGGLYHQNMAVQVDSGVEHDRHKRVPRARLSSGNVDSSKACSVRSKGNILTEKPTQA